jgi:hypothetical protein
MASRPTPSLVELSGRAVARSVARMKEERLASYFSLIPKDLWGTVLWQLSKCNLLERGRFVKHLLPQCAAYVDGLQFSASARQWLYDADVNLVVKQCPGLCLLDLTACHRLMTPQIKHAQLTKLVLLAAGRKDQFNPTIDCPQLRSLALQLTNIRVFKKQMALLEGRSPLLEELHLVGPIDLKVLSIQFPKLRTLHLIGCISLRMSSILGVIAHHQHLTRVILDDFLRPELPEALARDDDATQAREGQDEEKEEEEAESEEDRFVRIILERGVAFEFVTT